MFQSTPLCEGRPKLLGWKHIGYVVSIHAPVRGATIHNTPLDYCGEMFQSTPLCEGRLLVSRYGLQHREFQSTPLCEGRRDGLINPPHTNRVSIHAPARGATVALDIISSIDDSFNPRPRTGGDPQSVANSRVDLLFQSTPPHGGRPKTTFYSCLYVKVSIHAPARGATHFL